MNKTQETQSKQGWITRLQEKWGVENALQVIFILIVFSLAGSTVVVLRKSFFSLLGFDATTNFWLKTITYILFIFPTYQVLLLGYGFLFGQFRFFWAKEVKMVMAIRKKFSR